MLASSFDVSELCKSMGVSRSGYYKWKKRDKSQPNLKREQMIELVRQTHEKHRTHGYKWTAAFIRIHKGYNVSNNFVYKCFIFLGISAETKHKTHYKSRDIKDKYPNLLYSTWDTVDRPRQVIVSDMTAFKLRLLYAEVTFYFDVFTKEMLTFRVADRRGDRMQYIDGLEDVRKMLAGCIEPTILHTDQGSVYASVAYNDLIKDSNIVRSMSRAGKPTDNPVNESINGWMKEELIIDFNVESCSSTDELKALLRNYMVYFNEQRPCFALGYNTPARFYRMFLSGQIEQKDTFNQRVLDPLPKFVRERKNKLKDNNLENKSTSEE